MVGCNEGVLLIYKIPASQNSVALFGQVSVRETTKILEEQIEQVAAIRLPCVETVTQIHELKGAHQAGLVLVGLIYGTILIINYRLKAQVFALNILEATNETFQFNNLLLYCAPFADFDLNNNMVLLVFDVRFGLVIYDIRKRRMEQLIKSGFAGQSNSKRRKNHQIIEDQSCEDSSYSNRDQNQYSPQKSILFDNRVSWKSVPLQNSKLGKGQIGSQNCFLNSSNFLTKKQTKPFCSKSESLNGMGSC